MNVHVLRAVCRPTHSYVTSFCLVCVCVRLLLPTHQCQALKAVEREPYTGDVVPVSNAGRRDFGGSDLDTPTRPCTRHGGMRDMHESSFSLSGECHHMRKKQNNAAF